MKLAARLTFWISGTKFFSDNVSTESLSFSAFLSTSAMLVPVQMTNSVANLKIKILLPSS